MSTRRRGAKPRPGANKRKIEDLPGGLPDELPGDIDIPDWVLAGLPFLQLDQDLPLLLLPVRLETRYRLDLKPPELRIRILPDQIHVQMSHARHDAADADAARVFWERWRAATDAGEREAAWRVFSKRVGAHRAAYVARANGPGSPPPPGGEDGPATARLLPSQWLAIGMADDNVLFNVAGKPVAPDLRTAPEPDAPPWEVPGTDGLTVDERLAWMLDYDRAVEAGMAITVPLTGTAAPAKERIATLLVVGVDAETTPKDGAAALERILAGHARSTGLAFVAQGTPTNNTETARSGWSPNALEPPPDDALRAITPVPPGLPDGKPPTASPDNAARLASALGLADDATLRSVTGGDADERRASRAMLRVTYEAILGTLVRRLLRVGDVDGLSPAALEAVRAFCLAHVTGGAQQACLRVGAQPYGILPVIRPSTTDEPATAAEHVASIVALLRDQWLTAARTLPRLDPNATDTAGADDQLTTIATLLATQPHPARLFTRRVDEYTEPVLSTPQWWWQTFVDTALDPDTNPNLDSPYTEIAVLESVLQQENQSATIDDQIALWKAIGDELPELLEAWGVEDPDGHGLGYVESVLALLRGYEERQRPLRWIDLQAYEGVLGETNTALIEAMMSQTSTEWGADGIVEAPDARSGEHAADYLQDLLDRFRARRADGTLPDSELTSDFLARRPLLYQLLDATLADVPTEPEEEQAVELALADLTATDAGTLEWLLRECLGLGAHRLDAWATSLAAERLGRLRTKQARGLHIGGFGWVTDLTPRLGPRTSGGYIHAPSLAHATTAAVLRVGWLAHGTDDPASTAAVDITSERVRAAAWLLDGMRAGRPLGDLLGYRFERALHDLHADEQIRAVRRLVLDATDQRRRGRSRHCHPLHQGQRQYGRCVCGPVWARRKPAMNRR